MANGYNPFENLGVGRAAAMPFLTHADLQQMYGASFDPGIIGVHDPNAPRFAEGFIKAEDIYGEGVQGQFAGGGGYLNIGPNAIQSMGTYDPHWEQIGIRRHVGFDPFMGTHGKGGAFFSERSEVIRAFNELGLGRTFEQMGFKSEEAQQEAFQRTMEAPDAAQYIQNFFDPTKLKQEYSTNLMNAWEEAATRLQKAGPDYLQTLYGVPKDSPAAAEMEDLWQRFQDAQAGKNMEISNIGPMFRQNYRTAKSVGEWLSKNMGQFEPEDIAPFSVDTQGIENLQKQFTQRAPVAMMAYDAPGTAGALGGLGGGPALSMSEQDMFDSFYDLPMMGGYY
jgi:hypothetical protein